MSYPHQPGSSLFDGSEAYEAYLDEKDEWPDCPTCKGRGVVNPLTAPEGFFCVSSADCPTCEGSGQCP